MDIVIEILSLFFAAAAVIVLIASSVIIPIIYKTTKKKNVWGIYAGIVVISLCAIYLYMPWFFTDRAKRSNNPDEIIKYNTYAVNTSLIPKVKGYMYKNLSGNYLYFKKDLDNGIKYQELAYKYSNNIFDLYFLSHLYELKGDYAKALEVSEKAGGRPSRMAKIYFLKGDTDKALEILNKSIDKDKNAGVWEYVYRANIYDYTGKSDLAEKDFAKALEVDPNVHNYPVIEEIKNNKNYQFDKMEQCRKPYNK